MALVLQESFKEKKVISFSGKIASGKDTLALNLKERLKKDFNKDFELISFGGFLKEEVKDIIDNLYLNENILESIFKISKKDIQEFKNILYKEENRDIKIKTQNIRELFQFFGQNIRRKQNEDYWILKLIDYVKKSKNNNFIVTDARHLNEIEALDIFDAFRIKLIISKEEQERRILKRDGVTLSEEKLNHISERDFERYDKYDLILNVDNRKINDLSKNILSNLVKKDLI